MLKQNVNKFCVFFIFCILIVVWFFFGKNIVLNIIQKNNINYRYISKEKVQELQKENDNTIFLDVRTNEFYVSGQLKNSIHIPMEELSNLVGYFFPDKNQTIFVVCTSGVNSRKAVNMMLDMGYKRVYDVGKIEDVATCNCF